MTQPTLVLSAACEQHIVATEVSSQRTIEWVVQATNQLHHANRAPLNIALIIDRSGSMRGEKLRYVQQAACYVIDQLGEQDRVAVVAYDDTIQLVAESTSIGGATRDSLKAAIHSLRPGGATDLSGGWLEGCRAIAAELDAQNINRALLLTDGLANRGITDIEELAQHARELRRRGVTTSTFGVGLDFNEHLLEALAENGGGHFYFIEQPAQIPEFFRRELGELLAVVAREAVLTLPIPKGIAVEVLGDLAHERERDRVRVFLGDMYAGEQRTIYTRLLTPPDAMGTTIAVRGELSYANLDARPVQSECTIDLVYARRVEVIRMPVKHEILARASEVELAAAARQALQLERLGQGQQAQSLLRARLAAAAPLMAAPAAAAYENLAEKLGAGMDEAGRKQAHFAAYQKRQSRT